MGLHFGNLYKLHRIVYFRLSPYEQKPFVGMFKEGIPNMIRRIEGSIFRSGPIFIIGYLIYSWGDEEFYKLQRKNPALYENDQ